MTPATGTLSLALDVRWNVVDDVIRAIGASWRHARRYVVEIQAVAHFPRNDVIRARRIAAHADRAEKFALRIIKRETTAEDIYATDLLAHHWIVVLAVIRGIASIGGFRVNGVAVLKTVERTARLHGGEKICGGERESRQAERI